jgi:hypothetical protein
MAKISSYDFTNLLVSAHPQRKRNPVFTHEVDSDTPSVRIIKKMMAGRRDPQLKIFRPMGRNLQPPVTCTSSENSCVVHVFVTVIRWLL